MCWFVRAVSGNPSVGSLGSDQTSDRILEAALSELERGEGGDVDPGLKTELESARNVDADVVVLPNYRTQQGLGAYPEQAIMLVKELRSAGYRVEFLDPPAQRTFIVQRDAFIDFALNLATGLLGTALWEAGALVVRKTLSRGRRSQVNVLPLASDAKPTPDTRSRGVPAPRTALLEDEGGEPLHTRAQGGLTKHTSAMINRLTMEGLAMLGQSAVTRGVEHPMAEYRGRQALRKLRSALDWAEDTELEAPTHQTLDDAGAWVRRSFGCQVPHDGAKYWLDCPVQLAHTRIGLSVGGTAHKICSLCGNDLADCPHVPGQRYGVPGGTLDLGWCRVCMSRDNCEHLATETYSASAVSIVDRMDLEEVSFVGKPAIPDARVERESLPIEDLAKALGPDFQPGTDLACDYCLHPCPGLHRPFSDDTPLKPRTV